MYRKKLKASPLLVITLSIVYLLSCSKQSKAGFTRQHAPAHSRSPLRLHSQFHVRFQPEFLVEFGAETGQKTHSALNSIGVNPA